MPMRIFEIDFDDNVAMKAKEHAGIAPSMRDNIIQLDLSKDNKSKYMV